MSGPLGWLHELAVLAIASTEHCHLKKMVLVDVQATPSLRCLEPRDLDEAEPSVSRVEERATHGIERGLHERQLLLAKLPGRLWRGVPSRTIWQVTGAEMVSARVVGVLDPDPRIQLAVVVCLAPEGQVLVT
jgi:hypothetical protein